MFASHHTSCHASRFKGHMSCALCHMSSVTCHVSPVTKFLFLGQSGGVSQWKVCNQQGLPPSSLLILTRRKSCNPQHPPSPPYPISNCQPFCHAGRICLSMASTSCQSPDFPWPHDLTTVTLSYCEAVILSDCLTFRLADCLTFKLPVCQTGWLWVAHPTSIDVVSA